MNRDPKSPINDHRKDIDAYDKQILGIKKKGEEGEMW